MVTDNSKEPYAHLTFFGDEVLIRQFFTLLQQGVKIRCRVGCSVADFLRNELCASQAIIEKIQSIMLDGKPVDDMASSLVHDGSVLALSAAMPGLVGATLRRGGAYSSFRSGITYHEADKSCVPGEGSVGIKIFNLLMDEMGPGLLQKGVDVKAADLSGFLTDRASAIRPACKQIILNNKTIYADKLDDTEWLNREDVVFLTVTAEAVKT